MKAAILAFGLALAATAAQAAPASFEATQQCAIAAAPGTILPGAPSPEKILLAKKIAYEFAMAGLTPPPDIVEVSTWDLMMAAREVKRFEDCLSRLGFTPN